MKVKLIFLILMFSVVTVFYLASTQTYGQSDRCDSSYPGVCIAPPPPDLNYPDIPYKDFKVLPPDPHELDGFDGDGIGCESESP
jgi:hypothetical protein